MVRGGAAGEQAWGGREQKEIVHSHTTLDQSQKAKRLTQNCEIIATETVNEKKEEHKAFS